MKPRETKPAQTAASSNQALAPGPTLYLVATPIGNLEDITLRALRVLKEADLIACEDTRQTQKLLNHYGITTRTTSYHEHNEMTRAPELVLELEQGSRIALVSDAGMPGISDPGFRLIALAIRHHVPVVPSGVSSASEASWAASASISRDTPGAGRKSLAMRLPRVVTRIVVPSATAYRARRLTNSHTQANGFHRGSTFIQCRTAASIWLPNSSSTEAATRGRVDISTSEIATPVWFQKLRLRGTR